MTSAPTARSAVDEAASTWWFFLVTGGFWLLLAIIVFRFDWTTVSSISILFGLTMLGAASVEALALFATRGWWRLAHGCLAAAFAVIGAVAFARPGGTFAALAGVMSFYFIIRGGFDIVAALATRGEELWWLRLVVGIAQLLIGFWAAGYFGHRAILLVVWVGATALTRAISDFVFAFSLRSSARAA